VSFYQRFGKRAADLGIAIAVLGVASPVLLVASWVVWCSVGFPILFRHERPGLRGRLFILYKLRTMNDRRSVDGRLLPDAERLTRAGRIIRRLSVDELPQLFNVLKGDMSVVGPRPLLVQYLDRYTPEQARRHDAKPGITGWAQVNGRNALTWEQRFALDVWYVDNRSLWLDLRILLLTVGTVVARRGINQAGHATAREFLGTPS
jgi:sugar transferase EpsL